MILALWRIVFIVIILYLILFIVRFFQGLGRPKPRQRVKESSPGTMVKDECCNLYLPKEEAFREVHEGREYFFCSKECRNKFFEKSGMRSDAGLKR